MKKILLTSAMLGAAALALAQTAKKAPDVISRIAQAGRSGATAAVSAPDGPLLFTAQVSATDVTRDARAQAEQALASLGKLLAKEGGDLQRVLRLNVYVADDRATAEVDAVIARVFAAAPPAVTLVHSALATKGALVAFDAVAAVSGGRASVEIIANSAAVMPAGGKLFISGQAEKGADVATSVRLTMAKLHRSVAHLGLAKSDVVQVKAFIQPFADHAAAAAEVAKSFEGAPVPPLVLVEWIADLPAEIELVASARTLVRPPGEALAFPALPGMTTPTRYSRVTTVAAGVPLIFLAGIDAGEGGTAREQWKRIFEQLGGVLFDAGSSFRHLVKATYYLSDPDGRQPLGDIRDVYFDPARPPAASAAVVTSVGRGQRTVVLDLIAVPAR